MTHIMLDIETLGTRPGAVILSAAFVRFSDLASCTATLSVPDQIQTGMEIDSDTHAWWGTQSPEAWAAATQNARPAVAVAEYFAAWLAWAAPTDRLVWCHGASFDAPLLGELYRRLGMPCPWSFRDVRDTRTLYDLAGVDVRKYGEGVSHVALSDALAQTKAAIDALRILAPSL